MATTRTSKIRRSVARDQERFRRHLRRWALHYARRGWAVFPLEVGGKRPLADSRGFKDATTDADQINEWWSEEPYNIGIRCDDTVRPIILDADGPQARDALAELNIDPEDWPCIETNPKKGKFHLYFDPPVKSPDGGVPRTIKLRLDFDVLGEGGYVIAPPSIHADTGRPYSWVRSPMTVDLPPVPPSIVTAIHSKKATQRDTRGNALPLPEQLLEGQRDELLTSLAGSMRRRGASEDAILAALREENATRCQPPLEDKQVKKIAKSIAKKTPAKGDAALRELNQTYVVVQNGRDVVILQATADSQHYELMQESDFRRWLANRFIEVPPRGEGDKLQRISLAAAWLQWDGRREFARVVFKPGEQVPPDEFNIWRGWGVTPSPAGSCKQFLAHLRDIVCNGNVEHYHWLLDWLADIVQHPQRKLGYAVAFQGLMGTGKSLVGVALKAILGRHRVVVDKPRQVTGNFNAHLEACLLLQAEEAFWAGERRQKAHSRTS
jgi:hypothetical protein